MKKLFYLSVGVSLFWICIVEFLSRGVNHGPEYLPLHLSFSFLLCSLVGVFLQHFKTIRIMGIMLTFIPAIVLIFVLFEMIKNASL